MMAVPSRRTWAGFALTRHFGIGYRFDPETLVEGGEIAITEVDPPATPEDGARGEEQMTPAAVEHLSADRVLRRLLGELGVA